MKEHPAAAAFPMMDSARFTELRDDIAQNGLRMPITLCDDLILDGRNRYNACREIGIEPQYEKYSGDPWLYVWSLNAQRRDLVDEQRYLIWKHVSEKSNEWQAEQRRIQDEANRKRSKAQKGVPKAEAQERARTQCSRTSTTPERKAKASMARVNAGAVARGDKLVKERPDLAEKVRLGQIKPAEAHREMKRSEQRKKLAVLEAKQIQAPVKEYHVVVIDPPWPMQKIDRNCRPNQAEMDYPTMSEEELTELDIPAFTVCHLWLWTTHRFLPMALHLLAAWKFKYICTFVWHKPGGFQPIGLPQYNCEFALYARRGNPMFLDTRAFPVCFEAPRGRHSEKPDVFYDLVRQATDGPRVDMYGRREIEGFDSWGKEAPNQ